ncbi:MAG: beta-lactamase family protein [Anaerolineae bacterium]|nr:beta-lactamase family protein [Anaerolineae bacterium]
MKLRKGTPEEAGVVPERVERVRALAEGWVDAGATPALVVLAARRGVIFLHEAFGKLRPGDDAPDLALDSIYPLASISKTITATAVMRLVEDGRVGLNRPVCNYIPEIIGELQDGKKKITVRHLLSHTSGLRDEDAYALAELRRGKIELPPCPPNQHPAIHEWLHLRYGLPLRAEPGTTMCYFNQGFTLAGEIVRRVSGESFADFCRARIFAPLGMNDTYFTAPKEVRPRIMRRPAGTPFDWWNGEDNDEWPGPAGGGYSTAMDMAIFGQMFLNGGAYGGVRVLSPATVDLMTRGQFGLRMQPPEDEDPFSNCPYGLGWFIFGEDTGAEAAALWSPRTFGHTGSGGVMLWIDPVYEIVGAFFFAQLTHEVWPGDLFANAVTAAVGD